MTMPLYRFRRTLYLLRMMLQNELKRQSVQLNDVQIVVFALELGWDFALQINRHESTKLSNDPR